MGYSRFVVPGGHGHDGRNADRRQPGMCDVVITASPDIPRYVKFTLLEWWVTRTDVAVTPRAESVRDNTDRVQVRDQSTCSPP